MNSILTLSLGLFSAFFPQTSHQKDLAMDPSYTCTALNWSEPPTMGDDGHLKGQAGVNCDLKALSGGGFTELQNYLLTQMQKQATQVNSGPTAGDYQSLPSQTYDFNMNLTFSGTSVGAHEIGTIATDQKTRLVSLMNTLSISGSSYDDYVKAIDITLDVTPNAQVSGNYHANISLSIDMTKPWYAPESTFESEVVKAVQGSVTNYQDTLIGEVQNNL
jgi:hypothetical protein